MIKLAEENSCLNCISFQASIFVKLPADELNKLQKRSCLFHRGEHIISRNNSAQSVFCIQKGTVQLYRNGPTREQTFSLLKGGGLFGYRDILTDQNYQHNARSLGETVACSIDSSSFNELLERNPQFNRVIIQQMANDWANSEDMNYNLGTLKINERLAEYILNQVEMQKRSNQGENAAQPEINLPQTRELMASLIGTTTESVIRTLSDFRSRGLIELGNGNLKILDIEKLTHLRRV